MTRPWYARLHYVIGDATRPVKRPAVIIHVCNDVNAWGSGFVISLSNRWPGPEAAYKAGSKELGTISHCKVEEDLWVFNLVAQRGIGAGAHLRAIEFEDALSRVCDTLDKWPFGEKPSVHCPRIGAVRGHTPWEATEQQLLLGLPQHDVYIYDLTEADAARYTNRYEHPYHPA